MTTNSIRFGAWGRLFSLCCFLLLSWGLQAQVSPPVPATTAQHNKQVIGYITQWDAWKNVSGVVPAGGYNQLNVDYSQYTILNFSFFGVAQDGSLHSGDYRNKNIYQASAVQAPAPLVDEDIYSSWDMYLLYGELEILYYVSDGSNAYNQGYRNSGSGWTNVNTGKSGSFPLSIHKAGGAPGVIELAHQKGVKVLASIGGWSMCKHYPEMAADSVKRNRFIASVQTLISMGFDGVDFDWEYPNDPGMNIINYSSADYTNFAILVEKVRAAIGPNKLITACFSASPSKLQGFNWSRLNNSMDYFDMMTYDYNGGWSNKAGHNAPLYDYPGAEYSNFSLHATTTALRALGVNMSKVTLGAPFYGRGVITNGNAALNAPTVKRAETVQPDGPIQTCADYTNWARDLYDGTPTYSYILQQTASGWTDNWDSVAQVPYMTKGNFFLSYDNPRSIAAKAQYIKDNNLAGVIVWQVYGDMLNMTSSTTAKGKLIYCPNTTSPLVNKINEVFASGAVPNKPPVVQITSPANNSTFAGPLNITITANASDSDGVVSSVAFYNGSTLLGTVTTAPYSFTWNGVSAGSYSLKAIATDNKNASTTSAAVNITVTGTANKPPQVSITAPANNAIYTAPASISITASASDSDGVVKQVAFYNGNTLLAVDTTAPYSYNWTAVAAGGYTLSAKATDNLGAVTTSDTIHVTVKPANQPPTVSITAPANNAVYTAPASITITASAADADGTVSQVAFYNGSTLLGTVTAAPYSYTWSNVSAGSYVLTAKATDNGNATTTSVAVNITVNGSGSNTCNGIPLWDPAKAYWGGDSAVYNGNLYKAKWWTQNNRPDISTGDGQPWLLVRACTGSLAAITGAATMAKEPAAEIGPSNTALIYPNPVAASEAQLRFPAHIGDQVLIEVTALNSASPIIRQVFTPGATGEQLVRLDLSKVPTGTWFVRIVSRNTAKVSTVKLIKL
ncbi:chitinase [Chitinophaga dinghuensis]|uniref:chitinase n=1 Tax=Chitinophaga dinghuensis TaxID=1539050 RepID=A0A327VWJ4_9BACT|nr:glycosyl hydrolase family 18 protein [Chitinophaga dinghuensis]RAJ80309.1 chitinase [Chitinophaga dinghuensis]